MAEFELILKCPFCQSDCSHQDEVTVFDRGEDTPEYLVTSVTSFGTVVDIRKHIDVMQHNPSPRRDGVSIEIKCELCGKPFALNVYQHKGQTFVECKVSNYLLEKEDFRQKLTLPKRDTPNV